MAGGLIQLMSYGYADKVLIGDPEITFFKKVYHKHALFAIQDHEIQSESDINFGSSSNFKIRNYGDLFYYPYLKVELPGLKVSYDKTLEEYISEFGYQKIENDNTNLILSKLNAILYNFSEYKFPIGYSLKSDKENNNVFNYSYDSINTLSSLKNNIVETYDETYNQLLQVDLNGTSYEKYSSNFVLSSGSLVNPTIQDCRNIYYSTFNVNYLTTKLNEVQLLLSDDTILVDDEFFKNFKSQLYKFITNTNENEFLYSIIKSNNIFSSEFSYKNKEIEFTNEIDFIYKYYFSNLNIFYIYEDYQSDVDYKKLKYIGFIDKSVYSGTNFTNVVSSFYNLYDKFKIDISGGSKFFISSGYDLNGKFLITEINNFSVNNESEGKYNLEFDTDNVELDPDIVYFIYPDIKPLDQDILQDNQDYPNYEDYLKLYYRDYFTPGGEIFKTSKLLLPICVLQYTGITDETDTSVFQEIPLTTFVDSTDSIFIYNDTLILNQQSQKNQYVLINNKLFECVDTSENTYQYSNTLNIDISGNSIDDDGSVTFNTEKYFIYSSDTTVQFIDYSSDINTFVTSNYTSPYKVYLKLDSDHFYYKNRFCPVNYVKNTKINLDSYENFKYNKMMLQDVNIDTNLKNTVIITNVNLTVNENMIYITNIFNSFLNLYIYFQQYNQFVISTTTSNLNMTISPTNNNNFINNIFTTKNYNGKNYFYNELQDIIIKYFESFEDIIDTYYTKLIRNITNLKYNDTEVITQDTRLMYILSNLNKLKYYISIISIDNTDDSPTKFFVESSLSDITFNSSKIYFKINSDDPLVDLSNNYGLFDLSYYQLADLASNYQLVDSSNNYYPTVDLSYNYYRIVNLSNNYQLIDISNNYYKLVDLSSNYDPLVDLSNNLGYTFKTEGDYYLIDNISFSSTTNGSNNLPYNLHPFDFNTSKYFYGLIYILNYTSNSSSDNPTVLDEIFLTPSDHIIDSYTTIDDKYKITLKSTTGENNINIFFDSIDSGIILPTDTFVLTDISSHRLQLSFESTNTTMEQIVDLSALLYHYAYMLYMDIKDSIGSSMLSSGNYFSVFNDRQMYDNLWHIMQTNYTNTTNSNNFDSGTLTDIGNLPGSDNYLITSLNMSSFIDHEIINNSLLTSIDDYFMTYLRNLIIDFINDKEDYFNFFITNIPYKFYSNFSTSDFGSTNININIETMKFVELFSWYLHYLNAIISDINSYIINYNSDSLFDCMVSDFNDIKTFFDLSSNVFNLESSGDYKGTEFNISEQDYLDIIDINKKFNYVLEFIIKLVENKEITVENIINLYSSEQVPTIYNNILFDNLVLSEILYILPTYYTNNFFSNYEYNSIVSFYNLIKNEYLLKYTNIFDSFLKYGGFSNNYFLELKQYLNFSIDDYKKTMKYFRKNPNYSESSDIIFTLNIITPILAEHYYSYSIINSPDLYNETSTSKFIKNYFDSKLLKIEEIKTFFNTNINLLDFIYENIDNIISQFNSFFNTNYIFYSDYRIIFAFLFYIYDTFEFTYESVDYELYLTNISDNTSTSNYIKDISNGTVWYYTDVCFIDQDLDSVRYTIKNNFFYDLSSNTNINYTYSYDPEQQIETIYTYSSEYYYIINNKIYDISNVKLGDFLPKNVSNNIYTFGSINCYYTINSNKQQRLYLYYTQVEQNEDKTYTIDGIDYIVYHNVFYQSDTNLLKFYLSIPTTENSKDFILTDLTSNDIITINPLYIRKTLSKTTTSLDTDLSSIFSNVFDDNECSKTITWINNTARNSIGELDVLLNSHLVSQLLNNCLKNGIFPSKDLNQEIIFCSSFNNYIFANELTSSDLDSISEYLDWLETYNSSTNNINQIIIFNITDQQTHTISDFVQSSFEDKEFCFVPESFSTYRINTDGYVVKPADSIEDFEQMRYSNMDYMLAQGTRLKDIETSEPDLSDYLSDLKQKSNLVKDAIINQLFEDISNETLDVNLYNPKTYFDISDSDVSLCTDLELINSNSYFIYNSNLISNDEKDLIFGLDISDCQVVYDYNFFTFSLEDLSGNSFLITTESRDKDTSEKTWDGSSNDIYYSFDYSTNEVIINTSESSTFPKTLFIYEGKLNRLDKMDFGYELDTSFNLQYTFRYDLSLNIISKAIGNFNYGIFRDISNSKNYVDSQCDISLYSTYTDFSNNILTSSSLKTEWDAIDLISDVSSIYVQIESYSSNLSIDLNSSYKFITINNNTTGIKTIFDILYMYDISDNYLLKLHSIDPDFIFDSTNSYSMHFGVKSLIEQLGTSQINTGCVLYYWEKFYSAIDLANDVLNDTTDSNFVNQKFSCKSYIEKIYEYITEITDTDNEYNSLFEIPECIFDKKVKYSLNNFKNINSTNSINSIKSEYQINKNTYQNVLKKVQSIKTNISRSEIPTCSWIHFLGHFLIDKINFKIDDNIIEELDDQIIQIYNFGRSNTSKDIGLLKMIGNIPSLTEQAEEIKGKTIYIPLPFFFSHHTKALPIISLLYSQLGVNLKLKPIESLISKLSDTTVKQIGKLKIKLCGSYVYLDTDERNKFSQMRHEYLVSIKKNYKYFVNENSGSLKLDLNLPASEMLWFYLDSNLTKSNIYWNYSGIDYKLYYSDDLLANTYDKDDDVLQFIKKLAYGRAVYINSKTGLSIEQLETNLSLLGTSELESLRNYLKQRNNAPNSFVKSQLEYNGHKRFTVDGNFSNLVVPAAYYMDSFIPGLNGYNFSRYPKQITHSGSLNFKYAKNIQFNYWLDFVDSHQADGEINIIFKTLNVLRIASGIGCLAW